MRISCPYPLAATLVALSTVALALAGCGGGGGGVDNDAAATDATTTDASSIPVDNDNDGYPADEDCDDYDPDVYPGVRVDCESSCAYGVEICLADGTWLECTATTDCDCTLPGEFRQVDCGNCGQALQECGLDLMWGYPGACSDEGECYPGEVGQETCSFCGTGEKTCGTDCQWGPADCSGVCSPGEQLVDDAPCSEPWEHSLSECSLNCAWELTMPCGGDCLLQPRTGTADFKDEVCIPGGPFLMGQNPGEGGYPDEEPQHTVTLGPYFMDVFEVTVARYRECVVAGGCTEPDGDSSYFELNSDNLPVEQVTWAQAVDFCTWDGGRRLPTEAEWEKGARGPAPRDVIEPWGFDVPTCNHVPANECFPNPSDHGPADVDAHPLGVSHYGLHQMAGNVWEWCLDWYGSSYYATSPSHNPQGPATGTAKIIRSVPNHYTLAGHHNTATGRYLRDPLDTSVIGIRCVRQAY